MQPFNILYTCIGSLILLDSNIVVIIGGSLGSCFGIVLCCVALVIIIVVARLKGDADLQSSCKI